MSTQKTYELTGYADVNAVIDALDAARTVMKPNLPTIRPSLLLDFANGGAKDPRITFTRASDATYFDANGILRTAAANEMRFDHDPATGEALGFLAEEQRTNLLTYSQDFSNDDWQKSENTTISSNVAIAPDGTLTADEVQGQFPNNTYVLQRYESVLPNTTYTFSVWLKSVDGNNLSAELWFEDVGFIRESPPLTVNNTWQRFSFSVTAPEQPTELFRPSVRGGGLYVWGAQLEAGAFATSYIPSAGSQATRAADSAKIDGAAFAEFYRQDEGTLAADFRLVSPVDLDTFDRVFSFSDGTSANRIEQNLASNASYREIYESGVNQLTYTQVTIGADFNKTALAFKSNSVVLAGNGTLSNEDQSVALPTVDRMFIGANWGNSSNINAHIRRVAYYARRLTNAELQAITEL